MLTQVMTTIVIPMKDPHKMAFIQMNWQEAMVAHITIPSPHPNFGTAMAPNFEMQEVILGKPRKDTTKALTTLGFENAYK